MQQFMNNFLPPHLRWQLIPDQMRWMWDRVKPHQHRYYPNNPNMVRYIIDPTFTAPIDDLLRGKLPPRYQYRHFSVPKKDGGSRQLAEPGIDLKAMQHRILEFYLNRQKPHRAAVGYRRGMSVADHAWAHVGARTIITADIEDFFSSTTRYRVRQYWKSHPMAFNEASVQLLTNLTTYRGSLPQGAPTSPALSNLVNDEMDSRLHKLASQSSGHYTRYADDIVFSWQTRSRPPTDFEFMVRRILREYGYRLNAQKGWTTYSRSDEPEITGTVLKRNGTVDIPDAMLDVMGALADSDDEYDQFRLAGYEGYRKMVQRG